MSAQDKLGLGMLMFLVFFVIAFLLVPRQVYQEYFSSLKGPQPWKTRWRVRRRRFCALAALFLRDTRRF